jgi:hypothetical protein
MTIRPTEQLLCITVIVLLLSTAVQAFEPDPVDWNQGLERIELSASGSGVAARKISSLGVAGNSVAVGFGEPGGSVSHAIDIERGTIRKLVGNDNSRFRPLPVKSGNVLVAIEKGNRVVLYDRSIPYTLPEGVLYRPKTIGIADGRFVLIPWFSNSISVYETNGAYLGSLTGFNDDGIVLLAGDGNLVAAATDTGLVYLWDLSQLRAVADNRRARVEITGITKGSPAEKAGISDSNYYLDSINGIQVKSTADAILGLRNSGAVSLVLIDRISGTAKTVTTFKDEGAFGLQVALKSDPNRETVMPLAVLAFGRDNRWLAWSGDWRDFEILFNTSTLKPDDIEKMAPKEKELLANQYLTGIAGLRWQGDKEMSGLLAVVRGRQTTPLVGNEDPALLQNTWGKFRLSGTVKQNAPCHDRFEPRKESRIKDRVTGLSWFWDPAWFAGPLAKAERQSNESGYRLATKGEILDLAHYISECRRYNDGSFRSGSASRALESIGFINMGMPLWTSSAAPDGRRYVCSIDRLLCVPGDTDKGYGVGIWLTGL